MQPGLFLASAAPIICLVMEPRGANPKAPVRTESTKAMNLARSYNNWRRYRETCNELNRLSQRELADLGIARSDIPTVARRAIG